MSIHTLEGLQEVLLDFADNPNKSWGEPNDGNGNPVDLKETKQIRRILRQSDINTARLNSGTYTLGQRCDFLQQVQQAKSRRGKAPTPRFPGDPDELPTNILERTCMQCGKIFRSIKINTEVKCFNCNLEALRIVSLSRHIRAYWRREDWWLEGFSHIDFYDMMIFRWSNRISGDNICRQSLTVYRTPKGKFLKLVLLTVASAAKCCYRVTFDLEMKCIKFARMNNAFNIKNDDAHDYNYDNFTEIKELDNIVLDFIVAMLPSWMLYAHYPRQKSYLTVV